MMTDDLPAKSRNRMREPQAASAAAAIEFLMNEIDRKLIPNGTARRSLVVVLPNSVAQARCRVSSDNGAANPGDADILI